MTQPLSIAFLWHMHQPYYRNVLSGASSMPWVRLHAAKDYVDMVRILESFPRIHQTFNLVPSLIDQLEEYLPPQNRSDQLLDLSTKPADTLTPEEQALLLQQGFMTHWDRMIKPHPRYHDLLVKRGLVGGVGELALALRRFKTQDYLDLQVWCHLVWCDPWWIQRDPVLQRLVAHGAQFTEADKQLLLEKQRAMLAEVLPTYRAFRAGGQIEVSVSPYYHPILPLLCDASSARTALPGLPLPEGLGRYPEEARWHLTAATARYTGLFGAPPAGLWPSEGSVSDAMVPLVMEAGFRWMATDEEVLWRSLNQAPSARRRYRPHQVRRGEQSLAIFFRDRALSDLIGFTYAHMHPRAAADDFLKRLSAIHAEAAGDPQPWIVSVMLDGENAWEYYANDGQDFLLELYGRLHQDERFRCVTMSEWLAHHPPAPEETLPHLFPGSWIGGDFGTWIGHPEKNRAWECVAAAYDWLQGYEAAHPESVHDPRLAQAWKCLRIAEGSDWNWWYGDDHTSSQDDAFDELFRTHVSNVYRALGAAPPPALAAPIKRPGVRPAREPAGWLTPVIDGRDTDYFEWRAAGWVEFEKGHGTMQPGAGLLQRLGFGFDADHLFLRVDFGWMQAVPVEHQWHLRVAITPMPAVLDIPLQQGQFAVPCPSSAVGAAAYEKILEIRLPLAAMQATPGATITLRVTLLHDGKEMEVQPQRGALTIRVPTTDDAARQWLV